MGLNYKDFTKIVKWASESQNRRESRLSLILSVSVKFEVSDLNFGDEA